MKTICLVFVLAATSVCQTKRHKEVLPVRIPSAPSNKSDDACPSHSFIDEEVLERKHLLQAKSWFRPCDCGGPGWERVAYYDFSRQECPPFFSLNEEWSNRSCHPNTLYSAHVDCGTPYDVSSLALPVEGRSYSSVCGQVRGYGWGFAFANALFCNTRLENEYITGVSLTHGLAGYRTHIWSFVAASFQAGNYTSCPCSNTEVTWPFKVPDYIGQDYFCDDLYKYQSNPLWDGQECRPASSCCEFNNPPYFCKQLKYTTSEDLEIRLLSTGYMTSTPTLSLIEIFIK